MRFAPGSRTGRLLDTEVGQTCHGRIPYNAWRYTLACTIVIPPRVKHILLTAVRGTPGVLLKPSQSAAPDFARSAITTKLRYWIQELMRCIRTWRARCAHACGIPLTLVLEIPFQFGHWCLPPPTGRLPLLPAPVYTGLAKTGLFTACRQKIGQQFHPNELLCW